VNTKKRIEVPIYIHMYVHTLTLVVLCICMNTIPNYANSCTAVALPTPSVRKGGSVCMYASVLVFVCVCVCTYARRPVRRCQRPTAVLFKLFVAAYIYMCVRVLMCMYIKGIPDTDLDEFFFVNLDFSAIGRH